MEHSSPVTSVAPTAQVFPLSDEMSVPERDAGPMSLRGVMFSQ
jgi:hypothetical protein